MNWVFKLSIFILSIHLNVALHIIPEVIYTESNGSYTAMLVDDNKNIKPEYCYLSDYKHVYEVDLDTPGVILLPNNTVPGNATANKTNIIKSLGNGICGFKLENVDRNPFIRKWNISFTDEHGIYYHKAVNVNLEDYNQENETIKIKMGGSLTIPCGNELYLENITSCSLYNPSGQLINSTYGYDRDGCSHYVELTKRFDFGQWKCVLNLRSSMSPKNIYYDVIEEDNKIVHLWNNETETHVSIGCYIKNSISTENIKQCEMIRPDGIIYTFKEGYATDRYTALRTRLSKGICGIEIQKPLENFEKGLWRCAIKDVQVEYGIYPTGGFINLTDGTTTLPPPKPEIPGKIFVKKDENFDIICRVPYSSPYCFIRNPFGDRTAIANNLEPLLGICKYTWISATSSETGTWSCGYTREDGQPDVEYKFDVFVYSDYNNILYNSVVNVREREKAQLKCSIEGEYPIQYCHFQNNIGVTYNIDPEKTLPDGIKYYGNGLKYGDCGIELQSASSFDEGDWNCITRVGNNFDNWEIYRTIQLQVSN